MPVHLAFTGAVEGTVDEVVLRRVLTAVQREVGTIYVTRGKQNLLRRLPGFNHAAEFAPWVVLVDLNSAPCPLALISEHLPDPAPLMRMRVAVRAIESWLLADRDRLATFLAVSSRRVPANPDDEANPKEALVNLARRSRRRAIRDDIVPAPGSGRKVGPAYEARLIEFVLRTDGWRPRDAATRSESLRRCLAALAP